MIQGKCIQTSLTYTEAYVFTIAHDDHVKASNSSSTIQTHTCKKRNIQMTKLDMDADLWYFYYIEDILD